MVYWIRKAEAADMGRILEVYAYARKFMAQTGNPDQWGDTHPPARMLEEDIQAGILFVAENDTGIHGVFAFILGEDPTYVKIYDGSWRSDQPYGTIHRLASDGSGGVFRACLDFCRSQIGHIRIDTFRDNRVMQHILSKAGFQKRGIIYVPTGRESYAYDLI